MTSRMRGEPRLYSVLVSFLMAIPFIVAAKVSMEHFSIFLVVLIFVILYLIITNLKLIGSDSLRAIYMLGGIIKIILAFYLSHAKPAFLSGVDWANFHRYAAEALQSSDNLVSLYANSLDLYVFLVSTIYSMFGHHPVYMYFMSLLFSFIAFRLVYKSVRIINGSNKLASIAALVYLFWPVNIVYSSSYLREAFIQMLVAWSFLQFITYLKSNNKNNLVKSLLVSVLAALVHSGLIAVTLVYIYIASQRTVDGRKKLISAKSIIVALISVGILLISPIGDSLMSRFSIIGSSDSINHQFAGQLDAATTYISSSVDSVGSFIATAPYRFVMFALSPFPWQVHSFETMLSWVMDGLLQITVVVALYRAWRRLPRMNTHLNNVIISGLLCIIAAYSVFAMGTNNYGSAMRHRTKVLPIVIVVLAASSATMVRASKPSKVLGNVS